MLRNAARTRCATALRVLAVGAGLGAPAVLAAGCGSSSPPDPTSSSHQGAANAAFQFAACMRNHGVTNFPDPQVTSGNGSTSVKQMVPASDARSPRFKSAQKACAGIMPGPQNPSQQLAAQQAHKQDLLAFGRCLRGRGISDFPDPTSQGQLTLQMVGAAGVDIHSRQFLTAADACVGVTHGAITAVQVRQAVDGSH